jgi:hypothetical protein
VANPEMRYSTIIISCLRVQSLTQYANTTNPTYDTLASGTWSVVELNVGIFCVCMPSFRRFFAHAMPGCFGSTEADSESVRNAARTPSQLGESGPKKIGKKKSTLPDSLFATTMNKTGDVRVESTKPDDDELQLMVLHKSHNSVAESAEDVRREADSLYKDSYETTVPKRW